MKRIIFFLLLLAPLLPSNKAYGECVFLKDGSIIEGQILSQTGKVIILRNRKRKITRIKSSRVMRILYTKLYMGRQHIRLTDGRVIQAYKVDEDMESLTFRNDLYKPAEFKLLRTKVLFIARNNPNELTGKADYTRISLSWKPPLGSIKTYRIYLKEKSKKYPVKPFAETYMLSRTIKGLKSSTDYSIIITAINSSNQESMPSNEINITTKNHHPEEPKNIKYTGGSLHKNRRKTRKIDANIKWNAARDSDGIISKYHIFLKMKGDATYTLNSVLKVPQQLTKKYPLTWTFKGLKDNTVYSVKIMAFDDRDAPSPFSASCTFSTKNQRPDNPEKLTIKKLAKNRKGISYKITWDSSVDPDGTVKKYLLYVKGKNKILKIGETKKEEYTTQNLDNYSDPVFDVRAVDNRGGVSDSMISGLKNSHVSVHSSYLIPLGQMRTMYSYGLGVMLTAQYRNWPLEGMSPGLKTGYFFFTGNHEAFESYTMIPLLASLEYDFLPRRRWLLSVSLSGGATINTAEYNRYVYRDGFLYTYDFPETPRTSFQPMAAAGLSCGYFFSSGFFLDGGIEYGFVIEGTKLLHIVSAKIGLGLNF